MLDTLVGGVRERLMVALELEVCCPWFDSYFLQEAWSWVSSRIRVQEDPPFFFFFVFGSLYNIAGFPPVCLISLWHCPQSSLVADESVNQIHPQAETRDFHGLAFLGFLGCCKTTIHSTRMMPQSHTSPRVYCVVSHFTWWLGISVFFLSFDFFRWYSCFIVHFF